MKKILLLIIFSFTMSFSQIYKDPNANIEDRIQDLLSKMTLEEKMGQMQQKNLDEMNENVLAEVKAGKVGSFLNAGSIQNIISLQKSALNSRLGIPIIIGRDVIHGYKTVLPIPLAQAATWNPELVRKGAEIAAIEAKEEGINWTFTPMLDISRDPRWGRIAESFGEDPYLSSILGVAMVEGFQGKSLNSKNSIAACGKHYVGYGATEGGRDYNTTLIPESELRNIYLKPFQAVSESGIATFMSAFNDLNGVPTTANSFTLKTILRDEWKFDGFVVSDWGAIDELIQHGFAKDGKEAAYKAINAGVNMEMVSQNYAYNLSNLIDEGKVEINWIDKMVGDILRIKFKLGLFENPLPQIAEKSTILSDFHKQIAKESAIESMVLLQNTDNFLPLKSDIKSLAIIGSLADSQIDQMGCWNVEGKTEDVITPLSEIKSEFGDNIQINYCKGYENPRSNSKDYFEKAKQIVDESDAVIVFVGEDFLLTGESHSRAFINLPGIQEDLVLELAKTGKPIVLVILAGRPLTFGNLTNEVKSIIFSWHPGTMSGPAISEILFGKVSPSGKLPVTFPRSQGQIPLYYNHKNTGRPPADNQLGRKIGTPENPEGFASYYLDVDFTPAYHFGFGLSYTKFVYSDLQLSRNVITNNDKIDVSVKVANSGNFEAKETVQLYIRDLVGSLTRPVKELKNFKKINLKPGETQIVHFEISVDDLKFYDISMNYNAEPGDFHLFVGSSSNKYDLLQAKFELK